MIEYQNEYIHVKYLIVSERICFSEMKKNMKRQPFAAGIIISIILLIAFSTAAYIQNKNIYISVAGAVAAAVLIIYMIAVQKRHSNDLLEYIKIISTQNSTMANDAISHFPLATAILRIDGKIMWYNDMFSEMFNNRDLYEVSLTGLMPDLNWSKILKSTGGVNCMVSYREHHYHVMGNIIESKTAVDENGQPIYSVLLYFLDKTETEDLREKYENEKTDIAFINIDNFDDIYQKMDDEIYQNTLSAISKAVSTWVAQSKGVMKKTDRDRYIVFFEHRYLKSYIKSKFDLLDKIRAIGEAIKTPITVSIGIGTGGHLLENEGFARAAIDMALGRGGDQAAVKDEAQYTFYGGNSKDYEKSTRVKTRAFAVALKDFIAHSDKVIFMGHANADYDCLGAAVGLQRAVRSLGKKPYIVFDNSPSVKHLSEEIRLNPEYDGMLISNSTAMEILTADTLLVILDTHRPSMLPCPELLKKAKKIILIDHHRRSTEFIENTSLVYHEPYASSTCEMATEILQYIDERRTMTSFEAMALYVGILMDTKNFITKTGVRTFEAASYLKRYGLDTSQVKRMFNIDKDEYMRKLDIVKTTQLYNANTAIAMSVSNFPNIRTISSQAADDMLNIAGTKAAFVLYPVNDDIFVSARSLGDFNVQLIMEKLGGGGHMTVAGAQLKGISLDAALDRVKKAIDEYISEK